MSDIIAMSRSEPQVELVVSRDLNAGALMPAGGVQGGGPYQPGTGQLPGSPALTPLASRRFAAQTQWRQKHDPLQLHHKGEFLLRSLSSLLISLILS